MPEASSRSQFRPLTPGGRVWGSVHSGVLLCTFGVFAFKSHSFQVGGEGGNVEVGLTDVITVRDLV